MTEVVITGRCPRIDMAKAATRCNGQLHLIQTVAAGLWCECEVCHERCVVQKPQPIPEEVPLSGPPKGQKLRRDLA